MKATSRLAAITSTLSFRLFLLLSLALVLILAAYTMISSRFQARILEQQARAEAARHGDLLRQGMYTNMLRNERERVYDFIKQIGQEPGVEAVRIYNKQGVIKFSSLEAEIGDTLDLRAEACYVCHASTEPLAAVSTEERSRIYRKQGGDYRVLGSITPIHNEESCWSADCHAHTAEQSILGVLDVQLTMEAVDQAFDAARRHAFTLAVATILIAMLLIAALVYRAVYRPIRGLRRGTEALARGELDARIELYRSDELGGLAKSFNVMADSLKEADAELKAWSQTLEERVKRKSEELERIHSQMMQVEKAASLGRMAATVAHELNNPLSGILTSAKLAHKRVNRLISDGPEKEGILDSLELIRSESNRCGTIVRDLLTYARQSSHELRPEHLHDLVTRAFKLVDHHIELVGVETSSDFTLIDDQVICDRDQIVQALIALVINAVEAMPDGGQLTVKTRESETDPASRVCVSVSDTGIGIPDEARERIFDPFFSTKDETKGVGLGLAVVYGIVQRHEGSIHVTSQVGKGTTFVIELPRGLERAQASAQSLGAVKT